MAEAVAVSPSYPAATNTLTLQAAPVVGWTVQTPAAIALQPGWWEWLVAFGRKQRGPVSNSSRKRELCHSMRCQSQSALACNTVSLLRGFVSSSTARQGFCRSQRDLAVFSLNRLKPQPFNPHQAFTTTTILPQAHKSPSQLAAATCCCHQPGANSSNTRNSNV
jgi:hypothetical protein